MSPEICQAETYNMRSDIWSLGCIMYELCAKEPPFNAKTHIQLAQNIRKGVYKDLPSIYSKDLQNVIANCLKVNPKFRPDTASLLTIPYVWIARKGLELVETGKAVRAREELAMQKLKQAEERLASLDRERELMHQQIEDNLRRKWEVKARLEIDRQIELGMERLQKRFDEEVNAKAQEIAKSMTRATEERALRDLPNRPAAEKDKENIIPQSSVSASGEEDFPSTTDLTDLSALSLESPNTSTNKPPAIRKSSKTPFARSKTTFDSPIDVQMGEPSPMSISSLALSPRRNAAAQAAATAANKNIFTEAARQRASEKWEPTLAYNSDDDGDEDEEDIPELLSPTRPKVHARDPFKMPARPGLARQATTATMQKLTTQPTLFPTMAKQGGTGSGIPRTMTEPDMRPSGLTRSPSNRRLSKLPSSTNLAGDSGSPTRKPPSQLPSKIGGLVSKQAKEGGEEMMRAVMTRNMNVGTGRTLVELAQARAGGRPLSMDIGKGIKIGVERMERELPPVPVWDPEKDEMPSPFLSRTKKILV